MYIHETHKKYFECKYVLPYKMGSFSKENCIQAHQWKVEKNAQLKVIATKKNLWLKSVYVLLVCTFFALNTVAPTCYWLSIGVFSYSVFSVECNFFIICGNTAYSDFSCRAHLKISGRKCQLYSWCTIRYRLQSSNSRNAVYYPWCWLAVLQEWRYKKL